MSEHTAENDAPVHPHVEAVRAYLDNAGITPETLRYAATHESLCRSWIFDLLTGLADTMEADTCPIPPELITTENAPTVDALADSIPLCICPELVAIGGPDVDDSRVRRLCRGHRDHVQAACAEVVAGIRAWCAINEIAEPPLDWAGLGEFLDRAETVVAVTQQEKS